MIYAICVLIVIILALCAWIVYLLDRISFIKWSHNYWVDAYFREVDKTIELENSVDFYRELCIKAKRN